MVRSLGGGVYVSNSGGVDSCVLSDLVHKIYPDVPDVFIDTGLEYPELRHFIINKPDVIVMKPSMPFAEVITKYGYPLYSKEVARDVSVVKRNPFCKTAERFKADSAHSLMYGNRFSKAKYSFLIDAPFKLSNKCCDIMKKHTAKAYEKETHRHPYIGTMTEESNQRESIWLKQGCNAFDNERPLSAPLSFWRKSDVLEYIHKNNLAYAPVYGDIVEKDGKYATTGCNRTGCVWCGFGAQIKKYPNKFQQLAITHPKLWDYCMRGGCFGVDGMWIPDKGLGMAFVLDWCNIKWWNDGDEAIRDEYRKVYHEKEKLFKENSQNNF